MAFAPSDQAAAREDDPVSRLEQPLCERSRRPGRSLPVIDEDKEPGRLVASIENRRMRFQPLAMPVAATVTTTASMTATGMSAAMTATDVSATGATAMSATDVSTAMTAATVSTAMPTAPALTAAPAKTAPVGVSAPIESGAVPAVGIEAIIPAAENELGLFDRAEIGSGRAQLRQRHRLRRAHHHQCSRSAQSERQPKLPHYVLMI
jgi:hypothetical protein